MPGWEGVVGVVVDARAAGRGDCGSGREGWGWWRGLGLADWGYGWGDEDGWGLLVNAVCFGWGGVAVGEVMAGGGVVLKAGGGVLGCHEGSVNLGRDGCAHDGTIDKMTG